MKIAQNTEISLKGPLSRNRSLRNLKKGDFLTTKVIKILNKSSAVLELKGNKVKAVFNFEIPNVDKLLLEVRGQNKESLVLKAHITNSDRILDDFFSSAAIPNSLKSAIVFLMGKPEFSNYTFFKLLKQHYSKSKNFKKKMELILKSFTKNDDNFISQFLLNKSSNSDIKFLVMLSNLFGRKVVLEDDIDSNSYENLLNDEDDVLELIESLKSNIGYYIIHSKSDNGKDFELIKDRDLIFMELNFSCLGKINVFISGNDKLNISIILQDEEKYETFLEDWMTLLSNLPVGSNLKIYNQNDLKEDYNKIYKKSSFEYKV